MTRTVMDDQLSEKYYLGVEALFKNGEWHREINRLGLDLKDKTVLNLAAGTGHWEEVFLSLGAKKVFWQDLSSYFYEIAVRRLQGYQNVEFILGDMTAIPLENESIDFVMCRDSIFHSTDEKKTLAEVYRVLKKGGSFYLTARNWHRVFREPLSWKSPLKLLSPQLYRLIGKKLIATVFILEGLTLAQLRDCGFTIDQINRGDSVLFVIARK